MAQALDASACSVLSGAEYRFQTPSTHWFYQTQSALKSEAVRVNEGLIRGGEKTERYWKDLFHWDLLEKNLVPGVAVKLQELELVRRWMYSNRKGTESEFFRPIREAIDAHLDAAFTFSHPDLKATFLEKVEAAKAQCRALVSNPVDANGVVLGQTLGWFERTRQLGDVVSSLRSRLSYANTSLTVSDDFIQRVIGDQLEPVSQSTPVSQSISLPTGMFGGMKTTRVTGTAHTQGRVRVQLVPNAGQAEFQLIFEGQLNSSTHGNQGPVTTQSQTSGPVMAQKSLYLTPNGIRLGQTQVSTPVQTRVTGISAPLPFIRNIAQRRANRPAVQSAMRNQAQRQASQQLASQFTAQVETQFSSAQEQAKDLQEKLEGFSELLAPVEREGAVPQFHGSLTTGEAVEVQFMKQSHYQFGAIKPCQKSLISADIVGCIHQSMINNMLETVSGGKTYEDTYFMELVKVLQPELPLALMVHSRAPRWSVTLRKSRPIEVAINTGNTLVLEANLIGMRIEDEAWTGSAKLRVEYQFELNAYGEYQLARVGDVSLSEELKPSFKDFLLVKMNAFFGEIVDGSGVVVPEGGILGKLQQIQNKGILFHDEWIVFGLDVPSSLIKSLQNP